MESIINHPDVEMIWNFWPFDLILWFPLKFSLNSVFFWAYPFFLPFFTIWNFIPQWAGIIAWCTLASSFFLSGLVFFSTIWLWTTLTYLYVTAWPDIFVLFGLALFIGGVVYAIYELTGGTFSLTELGKASLLLTKELKTKEGIPEEFQ